MSVRARGRPGYSRLAKRFFALLVLSGMHSGIALAQGTAARGAGEIVTVGIEIPASLSNAGSSDSLSIAYTILEVDAGRLMGPTTGVYSWSAGEEQLIPVTLALRPDLTAGDQTIARVVLVGPAGRQDTVDARVEVRRLQEFQLSVDSTSRASRGRTLKVHFRVTNTGNAPDTAVIIAIPHGNVANDEPPPVYVLDQGQSAEGVLRLEVFADAAIGTAAAARLTVEGETAIPADVSAVIQEPGGLFSGVVRVPTSVFVGTTIRQRADANSVANPVIAVWGRGTVAAETEIEYGFRSTPQEGMSFAFRGAPYGPRYFLALRRPGFEAALGELTLRTSALSGNIQQGVGGNLRASTGPWMVNALVAAPTTGGSRVDGHVVSGRLDHSLSWSTVGLRIDDVERRGFFDPGVGSRVMSALASIDWNGGSAHLASVEAGWMRVQDFESGEEATGPAIQAVYSYRSGPSALDVRARTIPGIGRESRLPGRQLRANGVLGVTRRLGILAGAYFEQDPLLGTEIEPERKGAELGGRLFNGRASVDLLGRVRNWKNLDSRTYRTAVANLALPLGDVFLDGSLELGVVSREGLTSPVRYARVGAQWYRGAGWIRGGLRHTYEPMFGAETMLEFGASQRLLRRASVFVNGALPLGRSFTYRNPLLQVGAEIVALRGTVLMLGAETVQEFGPGSVRGWKASIGIRQSLDLAMPIEKPAPLSGVVFIDMDGNGVRTGTEPLAAGVLVRSGVEEAVTDGLGRFRFVTAGGRSSVTIDPTSLESGLLPPESPVVPTAPHIGVPIVPSTALEIEVFLDEDGDGVRDPGENTLSDISVSLVNEPGSAWALRTGRDGTVRLNSLRPGQYSVEIVPESLPSRARLPDPTPVRLLGGQTGRVRIPVQTKNVRFRALANPLVDPALEGGSDR
ncbi:MAG: hypothetical protein JJE01_08600 [Gemmatimonadetes bacterium]|nr:hypothetical protein [Gemmatimonadota bacterium]